MCFELTSFESGEVDPRKLYSDEASMGLLQPGLKCSVSDQIRPYLKKSDDKPRVFHVCWAFLISPRWIMNSRPYMLELAIVFERHGSPR